jgi:tellurite resistance protein TehA-like permease
MQDIGGVFLILPSFDDVVLLVALLAIFLILPAQLLFPYRARDMIINKLRFKRAAHVTSVIAIALLLIKAYIIIATGNTV